MPTLTLPASIPPAAVAWALAALLLVSSLAMVGMLRRRHSPLRRLLDRRLAPARGFDARTTGAPRVVQVRGGRPLEDQDGTASASTR